MYKNYLKVAWRNLRKFKMYSAIKIGGFAIGIAAAILITLFVLHESSYDQHYANTDRIYRVINNFADPTREADRWPAMQPQLASVLEEEFPEIEKSGRLIPYDWYDAGSNQFRPEERVQNNYEEGFAYMDQSLLEILEIPMVYGERETALANPKTIVISQKMADKYYPDENPVGKSVILNEKEDRAYTIGGVMEDFPSNSHLQYDFLLTLTEEEFWEGEQTSWCCSNYNTYALLRRGTQTEELEPKLLSVRDKYLISHFEENGDVWAEKAKNYLTYDLVPVADTHLKSKEVYDVFPKSDIRIIRLFGAIAVFILLLACINFINLSTAKSANRAKETGLRKVVGSHRSHLIQQFLTESVLFSAISVGLGTLLARVLLPYFNELSGKTLSFPWTDWWFLPVLAGVTLLIGLLAGVYPSFYLSAFKPIDVLKGKLSRGTKAAGIRSTMVVFQFATSMVLIVSAFIVYNQMQFILHKDLGFDKEQVVMLQGTNTLEDKLPAFKDELLRLPGVTSAAASNYFPVSGTKRDQNSFWIEGRKNLDPGVGAQIWRTDEDYLSALDINLIAGRNFSPDIASDTGAIVINQTMADKLGLEDPVGARIENWGKWTVIGVVEDFHFESMKGGIGALGMIMSERGSILATEISAENIEATLAAITGIWDNFMPNQPIRYTFMDETFARMYADVQRTGNVFAACAILAIIIACLGLFGLATFMAEQRSKEVSIRKVLGASMSSLYQLLTADFLKLILISLLIGAPIAWYLMRNWLEDYEYRIDIAWWFFAVPGLIIVGIALFTVSRQALKLAFSSPVDHLRGE
ncbi:hypothetical protein CRP01_16755 [Flavilitoribacter nigricans DSM 23189 = NBRC 102662]|uniref:ABC transporter permease n=2 Tax=Flavilitoribacter TaxID=2762562 RepID=A0A2D0NAK3_FLAN2|nr:hypothetical protein CRP01_16755 [Flavilitoribacter nigricans DSM 23189 = NBRC 102662]